MSLPSSIMVHSAQAIEYDEPPDQGEWIEGEPGLEGGGHATPGPAFPCVLFLPTGMGEQPSPYRPRTVEQPTLLFNPARQDGTPVVLPRESELLVTAPELAPWTGGETVRWQLVGVATPFGPPGVVIGVQAVLRQVVD